MSNTPRIPNLPRDRWTDAARDMFSYWEGADARENGSKSNVMMAMANHPALGMAVMDFGKYFLTQSTLPMREREIVILRTSWRMGCDYEWAHHVHSAKQFGLDEADFVAVAVEGVSDHWSGQDAAIIRMVDALQADGRIGDALWAELSALMNTEQIMDLLFTVGFITTNAWAIANMRVALEPDFASFSKSAGELLAAKE